MKTICSAIRKISTEYLSKEDVYDLIIQYLYVPSKKQYAMEALEKNYRDFLYSKIDALMRLYRIDKTVRPDLYHDIAFDEGLKYVLDVAVPKFIKNKPDVDDDEKILKVNQFISRMKIAALSFNNSFKKYLKDYYYGERLDAPIKDEQGRSKYEMIEDVKSLDPSKLIIKNEIKSIIRDAVKKLSPQESYIIYRYFGIEPDDSSFDKIERGLRVPRKILVENLYKKDIAKIPEIAQELKNMTGSGSIGGVHAKIISGIAELKKHLKNLEAGVFATTKTGSVITYKNILEGEYLNILASVL